MTVSLFRSGLLPRLGGALVFCLVAFGAVYLLRGDPAGPSNTQVPGRAAAPPKPEPAAGQMAPAGTSEHFAIESVRAVTSWTVRLDGETPADSTSESHHWSGSSASRAAVLSVDAVPADATDGSGATNCLRIRLRSGNIGIEWLEWVDPGEVVIIPLDHLRATAPHAMHPQAEDSTTP